MLNYIGQAVLWFAAFTIGITVFKVVLGAIFKKQLTMPVPFDIEDVEEFLSQANEAVKNPQSRSAVAEAVASLLENSEPAWRDFVRDVVKHRRAIREQARITSTPAA